MLISDMCPIPRSSKAFGEQPCAAFKVSCPGRLIAKSSRATIKFLRFRVQGLDFSRRGFRARVQGLQLMLFRVCASGFRPKLERRNCASRVSEHLQVSLRFKLRVDLGPAGRKYHLLTSTNSPAADQL